jgi:hypothetical protein
MPVTPNPPTYEDVVSTDLISLEDYKLLSGIDATDTRKDEQLAQMISWASVAVSNYAQRGFGLPVVTETRQFVYNDDDAGFLDIDDTASVATVALVVPHGTDLALTTDQWVALPPRRADSHVYTYIALAGFQATAAFSSAMGFTRNLDVYAREGRLRGIPTVIKVTADWGWPLVPSDVSLATAWTVQDWLSKQDGEGLTAESIENYSRAWGRSGATVAAALAIPNRARDLLTDFQRIPV